MIICAKNYLMKRACLLLFLTIFCPSPACSAPSQTPSLISHDLAQKVAERIWQNECRGTIEGLTSWNNGEEFASLGIGHFIWYPPGPKGRFKETFPELLAFLERNGTSIPYWIKSASGCPWESKKDFDSQKNSERMLQLRKLLYDTRSLQAEFIASRLENCLPKLLDGLPPDEKLHLESQFHRLDKSPEGLYALIDYVNFKGEGLTPSEAYHGKGWGLRQVLIRMDNNEAPPVQAFITSAKKVLSERVQNSPAERGEERWLKGWFNRLETYHSH